MDLNVTSDLRKYQSYDGSFIKSHTSILLQIMEELMDEDGSPAVGTRQSNPNRG